MSNRMLRDVVRIFVTVAAACCVVSAALSAQDKTIVLRAARMFDGHDVRAPGLVVVSGSVISLAGPAAEAPVGAQVIDFGDATLSPGFIDAHTHLSSMYRTDYRDGIVDSVTKPVSERTLFAVENLKKTLMAGITTAR